MAPMPPVSLRIEVSYYQAYQTHIPDILDDVLDDIRFYSPKPVIWPLFWNSLKSKKKRRPSQLCRAILAEMSAAYAIFVLANEGIARTKTLSLPPKKQDLAVMAKQRNPSFEILRVVAMFLIVVWHFLMHGVGQKPVGVSADAASLFNLCSMELAGCLSKVSTNCYILITGYFLINSTKPKWPKIPKTWAPIFFYSVVIFALFFAFSDLALSRNDFGKSLMPLYFDRYWFATRYVALVALAPFLATLAQTLTRRQYIVLLAVMAVINFDFLLGDELSGNNSLPWFVFLFFVGGYIRLHFDHDGPNHFGKAYFAAAVALAAVFLGRIFIHYSPWTAPMMVDYHDNNGILFGVALLLFLWTARLKAPNTTFVRAMVRIAPLTFGVYLIHDNVYVRHALWNGWIDVHGALHSWWFVPLFVASTVAIFIACIAIDAIRDRIFRLLRINDRIDTLSDRVSVISTRVVTLSATIIQRLRSRHRHENSGTDI